MKRLLRFLTLAGALAMPAAQAFDPVTSMIGKGVATALDVRSKAEVTADVEIDAAVTKKLVDRKGDDFKNISLLVFARHGVLVGFARSEEAKRQAEELARGDKRLRSLKNEVIVGTAGGSFGANAVLDKKIDLKLTATKGVSSVNMRWKVYGGDVFLAGVAQNAAEMKLAESAVRGVDGVKALHSSLRIGKK
jgi:osmotically-inducible protein OsmY